MKNQVTMLPYKYRTQMSQVNSHWKQKIPRKKMKRRARKRMPKRWFNKDRVMKVCKSNAKRIWWVQSNMCRLMVF